MACKLAPQENRGRGRSSCIYIRPGVNIFDRSALSHIHAWAVPMQYITRLKPCAQKKEREVTRGKLAVVAVASLQIKVSSIESAIHPSFFPFPAAPPLVFEKGLMVCEVGELRWRKMRKEKFPTSGLTGGLTTIQAPPGGSYPQWARRSAALSGFFGMTCTVFPRTEKKRRRERKAFIFTTDEEAQVVSFVADSTRSFIRRG